MAHACKQQLRAGSSNVAVRRSPATAGAPRAVVVARAAAVRPATAALEPVTPKEAGAQIGCFILGSPCGVPMTLL